jgi:alkanesulfonate monooxygenase SsuD/methylene tetrahydromethanopterin reductase-like flavin-dependent oxidoreductase (luciferase family)
MRVGLSEQSARKPGDPRAGARWMVERAAAARRAGLDSLFVGDHHATPGPYFQNVPITARMLAEWGDRPAGCLFLLPLWNPVLVAEQVGTLAAIAQGRFIIQAGLGDDEAQFAAMGTTVKTRVSAFEQSLDAVRRLLAGEVVSASGRFAFREARVALRPAEPVPRPPSTAPRGWATASWPRRARRRRKRARRSSTTWSGAPFTAAGPRPSPSAATSTSPTRRPTPRPCGGRSAPAAIAASTRPRSSSAPWTR